MVLDAIRDARAAWPAAEIDLAVGSVECAAGAADSRTSRVVVTPTCRGWRASGAGDRWPTLLVTRARLARARYDLVVNFEPDIRSNFLAWLTGAPGASATGPAAAARS